ncbi:ATP-grasp domain-containing protein [Paenibacillus massiliensis]|uniref:ATP-grasp domain-containing protein n=1 Tax=Paenibacillus massiliensis TaxID=225917 RepID=UPI000404E50D|nr:ATP-grasp domain-containing protein [Paenibacillus massiliensis]
MAVALLHKSKRSSDYYKWLESLNEDLYLISAYLHPEEQEHYTAAIHTDDYLSISTIDELLNIASHSPLRQIITFAEEDIIRVAELREKLQISGQGVESAVAYRDKVQMKTWMSRYDIPCADFQALTTMTDVLQFKDAHGYPFIFKPIDGFGSMRTQIIRNDHDLHLLTEAYGQDDLSRYMLETFIEGDMHSSNGIAIQGKIRFCSINRYSTGGLHYQDSEPDHLVTMLAEDDPLYERILLFTQQVIDALPTPEVMVFHCELFVRDEDLIFCEIASRPPGGYMCEGIWHANSVDLKEAFVKLTCGIEYELTDRKQTNLTAIYYIQKREGKLLCQPNHFPFDWVKEHIILCQSGQWYNKSAHSADFVATIVFTGTTTEELMDRYHIIKQYCTDHVLWETSS